MKFYLQKLVLCLGAALLLVATPKAGAFALLGPIQPWMQATNGVIQSGDIGGPMNIGEGYRWNVPVVTYGFDKSFLDYFGTNGVAAVEGAIAILNNLPPASSNAWQTYPFFSTRMNYRAEEQSLLHLKSVTLSLLLEQMGLAPPTRNIFVLKEWNPDFANFVAYHDNGQDIIFENSWPEGTIPRYIVQRNYDPQSLSASEYVDGIFYESELITYLGQHSFISTSIDPVESPYSPPSVADFNLQVGGFYNGLTYDDAGGLAYLLSTNTVNYETLITGVTGDGTNSGSFVNGAWRPGVDKITFIPHPKNRHKHDFSSITNHFVDHYFTNGILKQQQLKRIISKPDFLFSAGDAISTNAAVPLFTCTTTTNWLNNALANGKTNGDGPGVIQPQVKIMFNKLGPTFFSDDNQFDEQTYGSLAFYGSFDGTTNNPIVYPIQHHLTNDLTVRMWFVTGPHPFAFFYNSFTWKTNCATGASFTLQNSTNFTQWTDIFTVTNNGSICTFLNFFPRGSNQFYRLIPQ